MSFLCLFRNLIASIISFVEDSLQCRVEMKFCNNAVPGLKAFKKGSGKILVS